MKKISFSSHQSWILIFSHVSYIQLLEISKFGKHPGYKCLKLQMASESQSKNYTLG